MQPLRVLRTPCASLCPRIRASGSQGQFPDAAKRMCHTWLRRHVWTARGFLLGRSWGAPFLCSPPGSRLTAGPIATEEVWAFAPDFSWVRTFSGFYRLGTPHPGEHRLASGR